MERPDRDAIAPMTVPAMAEDDLAGRQASGQAGHGATGTHSLAWGPDVEAGGSPKPPSSSAGMQNEERQSSGQRSWLYLCTQIDSRNPEELGFALLTAGRTVCFLSLLFLSGAITMLASKEVGCWQDGSVVQGAECKGRVFFGLLQPTSMLTAMATVGGLVNALLMPVVGAAVDFTPFRWHVRAGSSVVLVLTNCAQASVSAETWMAVSVLQCTLGAASYMTNAVCTLAYMPELKTNIRESIGRVNAVTRIWELVAVVALLIIITMVSTRLSLGVVHTAVLAQALLATCGGALMALGCMHMQHRPGINPEAFLRPVPQAEARACAPRVSDKPSPNRAAQRGLAGIKASETDHAQQLRVGKHVNHTNPDYVQDRLASVLVAGPASAGGLGNKWEACDRERASTSDSSLDDLTSPASPESVSLCTRLLRTDPETAPPHRPASILRLAIWRVLHSARTLPVDFPMTSHFLCGAVFWVAACTAMITCSISYVLVELKYESAAWFVAVATVSSPPGAFFSHFAAKFLGSKGSLQAVLWLYVVIMLVIIAFLHGPKDRALALPVGFGIGFCQGWVSAPRPLSGPPPPDPPDRTTARRCVRGRGSITPCQARACNTRQRHSAVRSRLPAVPPLDR